MNDIDMFINNGHFSPKFHHRRDLTPEIRLYVAFMAIISNKWGIITQMAKRFAISRTFVYMLQQQLNEAVSTCFYVDNQDIVQKFVFEPKQKSLEFALLLRMEAKCSIPSISEIMKILGLGNNSVGTISQTLSEIGHYLPNTLDGCHGAIMYVYLAADEVYSRSKPILISVDPISTAIISIELAESRRTEEWVNHFNKIKDNGIEVVLVVSDEAQGICSATASVFPESPRQPDTFHAISHRLGKWVESFESTAYAAIGDEYHCVEVFDSAKTEQVIQKRLDAYFEAKKQADLAIILCDDFRFLYHCTIKSLQVFDKNGNPNDRKKAEQDIRVALDYMISLSTDKIKKEINTIYNLLDTLLEYLDMAGKVVDKLVKGGIPQYIVQAFSLAWQYQKNAIKAKKTERKNYFANKFKEQLNLLGMILGIKYEAVKSTVFFELDKIVQSSACVENINSIVRTFLNSSRNNINQEMLNLIMFYLNHRRYKAGKRKGKTPMELLTGKKQEKNWLEMLLEIEKGRKAATLAA